MRWLTLVLLGGMATSACSLFSPPRKPTLAELPKQLTLPPQPVQAVSTATVRQDYQRLTRQITDPALRLRAEQRLADLLMEQDQGEDEDAQTARQTSLREAITRYQTILRTHPAASGNDAVLYQLARAYEELGHPQHSIEALGQLSQLYPVSAYRSEALLRRGDMAFALKNYPVARTSLLAVLESKDRTYHQRALYKLGWTYYREYRYEEARSVIVRLLDDMHLGAEVQNLAEGDRPLVDDVVRIFGLIAGKDDPAALTSFLAPITGRAYLPLIYQLLGEQYLAQRLFFDAAGQYRAFADAHPLDAHAPAMLLRSIAAFEQGHYPAQTWAARQDFLERYGPDAPYWKSQTGALAAHHSTDLQHNLVLTSQYYHARGQQDHDAAAAAQAQHWYRTYLTHYPGGAQATEMRFLLAENLMDSAAYSEAAKHYEQVAYDTPHPTRAADAGYAALLAHLQRADLDQTARQRAYITSASRFIEVFATDSRHHSVAVKVAVELFTLADYAEALAAGGQLLATTTDLALADQATIYSVMSQSAMELGEYTVVEELSRRALALREQNRNEHIERLAAALYRQGEQAMQNKEHGLAAERFQQVPRDATIYPVAQYDAATAWQVDGQDALAIALLENLMTQFPTHELAPGAQEKLAFLYGKAERWNDAGLRYQQLARAETDHERRRNWLLQAISAFRQADAAQPQIDAALSYLSDYPEPLDIAVELRFQLAERYQQQHKVDDQYTQLRQIITTVPQDTPAGATRSYAAQAALQLVAPELSQYQRIELRRPLETAVKRKKELFQRVAASYNQATAYGVPEVIMAARLGLGQLYADFGQALLTSERPPDLDKEELETYDIMLEEQAFPFEEKAIELHQSNLSLMPQFGLTPAIRASLAALAAMKPGQYARSEQRVQWVEEMN